MWPLAAVGAAVFLAGCKRGPQSNKTEPADKKGEAQERLEVTGTMQIINITSKSAVIINDIPNIDVSKLGNKMLLIILRIKGENAKATQSMVFTRTSHQGHVIYTDVLSRKALKDENGKPVDLLSNAKYEVTVEFAFISGNEDLAIYDDKPAKRLAYATFKTPPDLKTTH